MKKAGGRGGPPALPVEGDKRRKKLGDLGERLAREHLEQAGYRVIESNWRCEIGELDLVAWHADCLIFVEVRTRRGASTGGPEASLTLTKRNRLQHLSEAYLVSHPELSDSAGQWPSCRVDLVAIEFDSSGRLTRLEIRQNVVEGS